MLITIGSITTATRLARLIEKNIGNPAEVLHTPSAINRGGCSYSVRINEKYENAVRRIIADHKVPVKRFYRESHNGQERVYHAVS